MKTLLVSATKQEIQPWLESHSIRPIMPGYDGELPETSALITGVGLTAMTYSLTRTLACLPTPPDRLVLAGIVGCYDYGIALGTVLEAGSDCFADLGAADSDGSHLDLFDLGLSAPDDFPFEDGRIRHTTQLLPGPPVSAITVHQTTGTSARRAKWLSRYTPVLESMEGAAFAYCAAQFDIPHTQLRAVSNYVEDRDREAWDIPGAVAALNAVLIRYLPADQSLR